MTKDEIIIRTGIVHILDGEKGEPVLSKEALDLTQDINDFFRDHIYKLLSEDELKQCHFGDEKNQVYQDFVSYDEKDLKKSSTGIAEALYNIMNANVSIPSADVAFITYQVNGQKFLAMLKFNYKTSLQHKTVDKKGNRQNQIVICRESLSASVTKLNEAVIMDMDNKTFRMIEKKYEINGIKENYLSACFLGCDTSISEKRKTEIIMKICDKVNKKFDVEDPDSIMETKRVLYKQIEEDGKIDIEKAGNDLFASKPALKEHFDELVNRTSIKNQMVVPESEKTIKKLESYTLKTDTGIEVKLPTFVYDDTDCFRIKHHTDGSISIEICNIQKMEVK